MSKAFRQEQIRKLARGQIFRSQAELARALHREGLPTTQVTLSRDLKELGLVKTPAGYAALGEAPPAPAPAAEVALGRIMGESVRDLRPAQNLLVVKTEPGAAPRVGAALDATGWAELAGTLAGDDTVLAIAPDHHACLLLRRRLRQLLAR
ncbi:MAG: arginine repressor [Terriglobales bacterium]